MGNWFWVLPRDVVCRRCNNEVLSRLDTALLQHPFISLMRVLVDVPGRMGQPPVANASNMRISRTSGAIAVETNSTRHVSRDKGIVHLDASWVNQGPRHQRDTARALLKFGLGLLWLAHGPNETQLGKYDHVRAAIQGDKSVAIDQGFGNSELPAHALNGIAISRTDAPVLHVALDYFGVQLWARTHAG
jgi:hypothetical protein